MIHHFHPVCTISLLTWQEFSTVTPNYLLSLCCMCRPRGSCPCTTARVAPFLCSWGHTGLHLCNVLFFIRYWGVDHLRTYLFQPAKQQICSVTWNTSQELEGNSTSMKAHSLVAKDIRHVLKHLLASVFFLLRSLVAYSLIGWLDFIV